MLVWLELKLGLEISCVRRRRTLPNAVEIDILGIFEGYSLLQIWPPPKIFQG